MAVAVEKPLGLGERPIAVFIDVDIMVDGDLEVGLRFVPYFARVAPRSSARCANSNDCSMEDKASGTRLIQELIADGCHGVTRYQPTTDKVMRLHAQTAMIENGFVHIPETAPWLDEYLHEMMVFPKGKHDDQVDSTAQFLESFKKPMPGWGIFEFYRQRARELEQHVRHEEVAAFAAGAKAHLTG